jgi:RNA polymerase sigma-70 factor (ECF subfamily)
MHVAEAEYLEQLKAREQSAFRLLIDQHKASCYRVALGFVRSRQDAEDIVQEAFITAFETIADFKADCALSTWMHRITVSRSLDFLRKKKRKKRFALIFSLFNEKNELITDPADPIHPGIQAEDAEQSRLLFAAIDALPEQQRIAFLLNKVDMLSVQETADTMNLSYKAVESLLSRARMNLKKKLYSYYRSR